MPVFVVDYNGVPNPRNLPLLEGCPEFNLQGTIPKEFVRQVKETVQYYLLCGHSTSIVGYRLKLTQKIVKCIQASVGRWKDDEYRARWGERKKQLKVEKKTTRLPEEAIRWVFEKNKAEMLLRIRNNEHEIQLNEQEEMELLSLCILAYLGNFPLTIKFPPGILPRKNWCVGIGANLRMTHASWFTGGGTIEFQPHRIYRALAPKYTSTPWEYYIDLKKKWKDKEAKMRGERRDIELNEIFNDNEKGNEDGSSRKK